MRGKVILIGLGFVVLLAAVVAGTWVIARRNGPSSDAGAANARSTFIAARGTSATGGAPGGNGIPPTATVGAGSAVAANGTPAASNPAQITSGPSVTGTVTKALSGVFTLQQSDNTTVNIATTADTSVTKMKAAALSDVKVGDSVAVQGEKAGDNAYLARTIKTLPSIGGPGKQVISAPPPGSGPGGTAGAGGIFTATLPAGATAAGGGAVYVNSGPGGDTGTIGKVTQIANGTLTLEAPGGAAVTVRTDANTTFRAQVVANVNDIKTGDRVTIIGDKTGDALYTARVIEVQDAPTGA